MTPGAIDVERDGTQLRSVNSFMRETSMTVELRWKRLADALGLPRTVAATAWTEIETAYTEPHRHYHTLMHIEAVLCGLDRCRAAFNDPDIAELALVYHDLVYEPVRQDNEDQSAARLSARLSAHIDATRLKRACSHIEATRRHDPAEDPDTNLVLDLDMSILGAPWGDYLAYAEEVFAEYIPVYGADTYAAGRVKLFLEPTLAKGRIFLTNPFTRLEAVARNNLAREMELWEEGVFQAPTPEG